MPKSNKTRTRIVVADDNKQVRDMVVKLLTPAYEVVGTAADGAAAFELVMLLNPEVVVLDITMPILSGIEASAKMRAHGSKTKAVFLTVHEDPDFIRAAMSSGASSYVIKSQMASDLLVAIRTAMEDNFFISPCVAMTDGPSEISK